MTTDDPREAEAAGETCCAGLCVADECTHRFEHCTCDPYCDVIKCTTCGIDRRDDDD